MSLTQKTLLSETPPVNPKTFGDLYTEIQKKSILTPEEEVALRKKVTDKYGFGILSKRKEIVTESTRDELNELLADLPDRASIIAKLDPLLPGKLKMINVTQDGLDVAKALPTNINANAQKLSESIAKATPNMPEGAQKVAEKLSENLSAGKVALVAAGSAVIAAPTIEGKAKAMDGVMGVLGKGWDAVGGFFSAIGAAISALFSGNFSEALEKLKGAFGMGEKTPTDTPVSAIEVGKKGTETLKIEAEKMTPEKAREIIAGRYWDRLVKSGYITNPEKQKKDFMEAFEKYQKDGFVSNLTEIAKNAESNPKWNIGDNIFKSLDTQRKFLFELIDKKVIPIEAIGAQIMDAATGSIRLFLKSPWILIDKGSTGFLTDLAHINGFDKGISEADKRTTISILHHNMTLPLYITGLATSAIARMGMLGAYWDQGTGVTKMESAGRAIVGDFDGATRKMNDLLQMLGADEKNSTMIESVKAHIQGTKELIEESQLRGRITQEFIQMQKAGKTAGQMAQAFESIKESYLHVQVNTWRQFDIMLTELRTNTDITAAQKSLKTFVTNSPQEITSLSQRIRGEAKSATYATREMEDLHYLRYKALNELRSTSKALGNIIESGPMKPFWNVVYAGRTINLLDAAEKGHLALKVQNATDAKGILEQIARALPEGFKHFFSSVAVTVAVADVASQTGTKDTLASLAKNLASLSPIYGGGIMLYEGLTMDHSTMMKPAFLLMGSAVFALGMKDVVGLLARPSFAAFSRVAFSPIYTVAQAGGAALRGGRLVYEAARFGVRPGGLAPFIRLRALGGYAAAAIAGYYLYESLIADKTKKTMEQAGFFEKDGSLVTGAKLTEAWNKVGTTNKSKILDEILSGVFQQSGITTTVQSDASVVMHADNSTTTDSTPMTLDSFAAIRGIFKDLGVSDPRIFMSESTTKAVKEKIATFALDAETKKKMLADFGIKA